MSIPRLLILLFVLTVPVVAQTDTIELPQTSSPTSGVINQDGIAVFHNYTNQLALDAESQSNGYENARNFFAGIDAGNFTSTGVAGTALGGRNVCIAFMACHGNETGWQLTHVGFISGMKGKTGIYNVGFGAYTLVENESGSFNSCGGADSCWKNKASNNSGWGAYSIQLNVSGGNLSGFGVHALRNNTTASGSTANGAASLFNNNADDNAGFGIETLYSNVSGPNNLAGGARAMRQGTHPTLSTGLGGYAFFNFNGTKGTGVGFAACENATFADSTICIGAYNGTNITTAKRGIFIGTDLLADSPTQDDQFNFGGAIKGDLVTGNTEIKGSLDAKGGFKANGIQGVTVGGSNCQITEISGGIITRATCIP